MNQGEILVQNFPCDLCGEVNEEFLYTKRGSLTNYPFRVVRCRSCGLIYLNPRLGEQAIKELYDRDYYNGKGFDPHVNYVADFDKQEDADKVFHPAGMVNIIEELVPPPAALLDFGCGLGDFMRQAARRGYQVEGFEVSGFAAEFASANQSKVYGQLDQIPAEKYDVVTAVEVLEHCSYPMKCLSAIHRSLKPGGTFYYPTGNFDGFYRKWRLGIKDSLDGYIAPEGHIHFYSTPVMKKYFGKLGFSEIFDFESKSYQATGRLFQLLSKFSLVEPLPAPKTFWGRGSYYGGQKLARVLGLRRKPLPLAKK
jgi:SAM-dependent methyltransferase